MHGCANTCIFLSRVSVGMRAGACDMGAGVCMTGGGVEHIFICHSGFN